jgi:predicted nucleic acid-binding Zn ribbon protein
MALPPEMERASKLIQRLRLPGEAISAEELARAAWPGAVGRKIAEHTRAARMVRTRLIVEVEDRIWQRQLFSLEKQILRNLEKEIGAGVVEQVEFRIVERTEAPARRAEHAVPQRMPPRMATQPAPHSADEAETISDPVLRRIYRASRQKAGA